MTDLALFLRESRHIFSVCPDPECGQVHRLSDLQLAKRGKYVKDWLDRVEEKDARLQDRLTDLQARAQELQRAAKLAAEKRELPKLMRRVAPIFMKQRIDPRHVRTLFHPVEFVVFNGLHTDDGVQSVTLLHMGGNGDLTRSIEDSVAKRRYGWNTVTLEEDGTIGQNRPFRPRVVLKDLADEESALPLTRLRQA